MRQGCLCHKTGSCVTIQQGLGSRRARRGAGRAAGVLACGTGLQQAQAALGWGAWRAWREAGGARAEACEARAERRDEQADAQAGTGVSGMRRGRAGAR